MHRFCNGLSLALARTEELRFLARVVRVALKSWVWTLLTSAILFYVCSIALAYGTYPLCQSSDHSLSGREELCEHFSTIGWPAICYSTMQG
eukprot:3095437-Amphidinium_carterae.1